MFWGQQGSTIRFCDYLPYETTWLHGHSWAYEMKFIIYKWDKLELVMGGVTSLPYYYYLFIYILKPYF